MSLSQKEAGFRFEFGAGVVTDPGLAVPVLAGESGETLFGGARGVGQDEADGGFALFEDGDWLIGVRVVEVRVDLGAQAEEIYRDLLKLAGARGRRLARIWNYVPAINEDAAEGLENYRVFCRGRAAA
ncbi:MAG: hypothetical protein H7067_17100, partial [Burkholderiales bacterium]|nr:hypothetical protein [Opitutaceae bacterium]